jgi:diguanylate cyclase (GGDEF)-like protein/PAS domain S-box-containing protein
MLGWDPADWIGRRTDDFMHPASREAISDGRVQLESEGSVSGRTRMRAKDGSYHWVHAHARRYLDSDGAPDGVVETLRTVDAEVTAERVLQRQARVDALTGLLNRNAALDQVSAVLRQTPRTGDKCAVLFCDIDNFKGINDAHGHAAGDAVLAGVAQRIVASVRDKDPVARIGGDEILLLLVGVHDLDAAAQVGQKIRRAVRPPVDTDDGPVSCTLSIGVTLVASNDTVDSAIARADEAMYRAKDAGRDTIIGT